jgi:hypothetical protein
MTVINGIEIDYIHYSQNEIKQAIQNNEPIDDVLHVICAVSNAGMFARRYILAKEFLERMQRDETHVVVYVVELAYEHQPFIITAPTNPRHLQLRTKIPIWHKENMINIAVRRLLPKTWKAMAWIDADVEFESATWAVDTLKILNGCKDVVQVYSHCVDMDLKERTMRVFSSFGHNYAKKMQYSGAGADYWHPGYGWAISRRAYDRLGGLYEYAILGSGDNIMAYSFIEQGLQGINKESSDEYKYTVLDYEKRARTLRLGYVPGIIRHHFHGSKKNRFYNERWRILLDHGFAPMQHLTRDANGLLIPKPECPTEMLHEIREYFLSRNEDEGVPKIAGFS